MAKSKKLRRELKTLISQQHKDDQSNKNERARIGGKRVARLKSDPVDLRGGSNIVLLEGRQSWVAAEHEAATRGEVPCPVCGGRELRQNELCLGCHRCGFEGELPGLPIDSFRNEEYIKACGLDKAKPTKIKNMNLKGGI